MSGCGIARGLRAAVVRSGAVRGNAWGAGVAARAACCGLIVIVIYVDDLIVIGSDKDEI